MVSKHHLKKKKKPKTKGTTNSEGSSSRGAARIRRNMRCGLASVLIGLCTLFLQGKINTATSTFSLLWPDGTTTNFTDFALVDPSTILSSLATTTSTASSTPSVATTKKKKKTISLLTSFFAASEQPQNTPHHPHRAEIEAAILANLRNSYFDQIAVILDSTTPQMGCEQFVVRTKTLLQRYSPSTDGGAAGDKLTCIDRPQGQPNYYEIFQYALYDPQITSDILVVSNADMVFDDTLAIVERLQPHALLTLSTQGYNTSLVPPKLREIYRRRMDLTFTQNEGYSLPWCEYTAQNPWQSWDSYIFHKSWLLETRPRDLLTQQQFSRPTFQQGFQPFYMNEMGAELAAAATLHAHLTQNQTTTTTNQTAASTTSEGTDPIFWNACGVINIWHFHLKGKMHQGSGGDGRYIWPPMKEQWDQKSPSVKVPEPWKSFSKCCDPIHQCSDAFVPTREQSQQEQALLLEDRSCDINTGKRIYTSAPTTTTTTTSPKEA